MTSNLPVPRKKSAATRRRDAVAKSVAQVQAAADGPSPAELADKHIQLWREGMAKLMLAMTMREDLDGLRAQLHLLDGWQILKRAALESPRVMAELRPYWKPGDKVEIRD